MKAQQEQIEAMLAAEGWAIVSREAPTGEWWLDEVWTIESSWSPVGQRAFVTFLVDPQAPTERRRGEHVWAVAVSRVRPQRCDDARPEVPLSPRWEQRNRDDMRRQINALRSVGSQEAG